MIILVVVVIVIMIIINTWRTRFKCRNKYSKKHGNDKYTNNKEPCVFKNG
jgi:uncharacterized membrane protein